MIDTTVHHYRIVRALGRGRILFGDGGRSFWIVDSQTREVKKIYSGGRDVLGPPRLTRDGRMAFYSRRMSESDIWLMTLR